MVAEGRGGALNGEKELAKLVQEALFVHISRNNPELHKTRVPMKGDPYTYAQWYTVMSIHGAGPDAQFPNLLKQFGANQPQPKPKSSKQCTFSPLGRLISFNLVPMDG